MKGKMYSGNEAIARGFYEAGGKVATSYPGSPTVGIIQTIKDTYKDVYSEFSINEKVAIEVGIGACYGGARTLVAMKHVGVNIAADPLMTFTQSSIDTGIVIAVGDDPGMSSSQNEQDSRFYGKFANMPVFDPSDSQEALNYTKAAFDISEKYKMPVMIRIVSKLCHSRSVVTENERIESPIKGYNLSSNDAVMVPPNTNAKQYEMKKRIVDFQNDLENYNFNKLEEVEGAKSIIITSSVVYNNLKEINKNYSILKLGVVYPLPMNQIKELKNKYDNIIVLEELTGFVEEELKIAGVECIGKELFSFTGIISIEKVEEKLNDFENNKIGGLDYEMPITNKKNVAARFPMFCSGCPHRPVYDVLKKNKAFVIGDIGCYSLALLPPLEVPKIGCSMGAAIGILKGMKKAERLAGKNTPLVATVGDGTFFHSGMTSTLNLIHQFDETDNMTLLILNNGTTAMTGGQPTATTGSYHGGFDVNVDLEDLLKAYGFNNVVTVDQFKYKEAKKVIDDAIKYEGLSIIITTRPCALNFKIKEPHYIVDPNICISCRSCIKTNCPPLAMKKYEGIDELKSYINPNLCVGCSVCAQVCPVGAIKSSKEVQ
jgi:indolepyruvate ferredoxin oxidoreductase alpha subunit